MDQKDIVSEEEEKLLIRVLEKFNLDISDAKSVQMELSKKLAETEQENIHDILQKQLEWRGIISQLQVAQKQLGDMKSWLSKYTERLMIMKKDIEQIEYENNDMEIQARNHQRLAEELKNLSKRLEFDERHVHSIHKESFDSEDGLNKIIRAVQVLEDALEAKLQDGMERMSAVTERTSYFHKLRFELVQRFTKYLKKLFTKLTEQQIKESKNRAKRLKEQGAKIENIIDIPPHGSIIYKELDRYFPLMKSVKSTDISSHIQLQQAYAMEMKTAYKKELYDYFSEVKRLIEKNKESRSSYSFSLSTRDHTAPKSSPNPSRLSINLSAIASATGFKAQSTHPSQQSETLSVPSPSHVRRSSRDMDIDDDDGDDLSSSTSAISPNRVSVSTSMFSGKEDLRVDIGYAKYIQEISEIVHYEYNYCIKFFYMNAKKELETPPEKSEMCKLLDIMFKHVPIKLSELLKWIEYKADQFYCLNMLAATEQCLTYYQNKCVFLRGILAEALTTVTQMWKKFIDKQIKSIEEYKCIPKKTSVVPFFAKFPYFIERLHNFITDEVQRAHAETTYFSIIKTMFACLDSLAETDPKHGNIFKMRNLAFFYRSVAKFTFNSKDIQKYINIARETFEKCRKEYVLWIIKGKFGELFEFFEGVNECLKSIDVGDIGYQTQFSKARLKSLIRKREADFYKDIVELLKRMDKHIGHKIYADLPLNIKVDYNLYAEVWDYLTQLFVKEYMQMEETTKKCYTNTVMKPSSDQIIEMFKNARKEFHSRLEMKH